LRTRDWHWIGEGNLHVVCRYRPVDGKVDPQFYGKVLRLTKEEDYNSARRVQVLSKELAANALNPFFGWDAVIVAELIPLPSGFLSELAELLFHSRPLCRRSRALNLDACFGELMHDATKPFRLVGCDCDQEKDDPAVSIELKVKCGLKSASPFVPSSRNIKRHNSRYQIMQLFKKLAKNPHSEDECIKSVSAYDPCDLCSGESERVRSAIVALLSNPNPQNNLQLIFNDDDINSRPKHGPLFSPEVIADALSEILASHREPILGRLQELQSFDMLDVEGAACVFDRLKTLSGSTEAAEEAIIEAVCNFDLKILQSMEHALAKVEAVPQSPEEFELLRRAALLNSKHRSCNDEELNVHAQQFALSLTAQDAVILLQLWLLALAAKDASLIISLSIVNDTSPILNCLPVKGTGYVKRETRDGSGVIIAYSLALVDFGLKSPRKCWTLEEKEREVMKVIGTPQFCDRHTQ